MVDPKDPLLDIPAFLRRDPTTPATPAPIAAPAPGPSPLPSIAVAKAARQARRQAENERLNRLADQVAAALAKLPNGARLPDLRAALPELQPAEVDAGVKRLRDRRRWAYLRERSQQ